MYGTPFLFLRGGDEILIKEGGKEGNRNPHLPRQKEEGAHYKLHVQSSYLELAGYAKKDFHEIHTTNFLFSLFLDLNYFFSPP